ncbi:MAG: phosphatidylglycerophosphatase A [Gammaproteobacteria bacterium]|jgi:phosphatidylglycerophosphatase A
MTEKLSARLLLHPLDCLALGCGSGLVPHAPGTAGTLAAVPLFLLVQPLSPVWYLALLAVLFLAGIPLCAHTATRLGVHDHPAIVWDEIVGYLVTMAFAPAGWQWVAAGFVLFRFFDIVKPWPIRWCDKQVHGGLGIMLDDLLAGVFAAVVLQVLVVVV